MGPPLWFLKGTVYPKPHPMNSQPQADLSGFTQTELDAVAWQLNTRPRKTLGWKCPAELFMPESFDFFKHHHQLVALRT